ncbi:MAG: hypothetical protein J7484_01025 [Microbacterium sp.]|nr:hypothetical protein [Microbacterium sp.]
MSRARPWILGAALVLAAALVSAIIPSEDSTYAAFLIRGDHRGADARTLSATVIGTTLTDRVVSADGEWAADGNWLVVELTASSPRTEVDAEIQLATLHVDGLVFQASERIPDSLLKEQLHVGTDTSGVIAFELPDGIRHGEAELRLTTEYATPQLDDVVAVPFSLDDADTAPSVDLRRTALGAP